MQIPDQSKLPFCSDKVFIGQRKTDQPGNLNVELDCPSEAILVRRRL
jgi:hypothetical protein